MCTLFQWDNIGNIGHCKPTKNTHVPKILSDSEFSFLTEQKERIDKERGARGKGFDLLILILADVSFKSSLT